MTFEESTRRLEEIISQLESGSLDLGAALRLFEEGVTVLRAATAELGGAEATLKELVENADGSFRLIERD